MGRAYSIGLQGLVVMFASRCAREWPRDAISCCLNCAVDSHRGADAELTEPQSSVANGLDGGQNK